MSYKNYKVTNKNLADVIRYLRIFCYIALIALGSGLICWMLIALHAVDAVVAWGTIITCIVLTIFFVKWNSPNAVGKRGEKRIARILARQAKKEGGYVINNLIIPDAKGNKTSQIDHVFISIYTIACIETKNLSGRVYGKQDEREWTQVLKYGKIKNKIYNPDMQNYTHVCRLSEIIAIDHKLISNFVVFVKGNIEYIDCDRVYTPSSLKTALVKRKNELFYENTVNKIYEKLIVYKENPIQTTKEHIQEIKKMQKDVNNSICPRCGGELVVRTGKDGSKFLGCRNYPRCKFTKKL